MRKLIIAGNWKMNKNVEESVSFADKLVASSSSIDDTVEMIVCPPFTSLATLCNRFKNLPFSVGAQNVFWEEEGAYTGETSALMIKSTGCTHVIIGHSERRQYFFETDEQVNKKIKISLHHGLKPIVCVGETLKEREDEITYDIIKKQIQGALNDIDKKNMAQVVIAYEPIWAIGTGRTATPSQANDVHLFIRKRLEDLVDTDIAASTRILYGGSVKPGNISELTKEADIDGALVGGASLTVESFVEIVTNCST